MNAEAQVQSRRAIEALRAGVPNRDAVRVLGGSQLVIEDQFKKQLQSVRQSFPQGMAPEGTLVTGDFGTGKSHLLEYLQHIALENNFVCSKVVISKETLLYNPAKVYQAAILSAKVPDRSGAALSVVATRLNFQSPYYVSFYRWLNSPSCNLSSRFAATVYVFERGGAHRSPEIADRIIQFWSGGKLYNSELKDWLKQMGETATYKIDKVSEKALALQRYAFAPQLMVAAGYAGWVVFIDEVELIATYGLRSRAKSYAAIARLLGKLEESRIPGLTTLLTLSGAFEGEVLGARKDDERIPNKLSASGSEEDLLLASQAERGMMIIRQDKMQLKEPDTEIIKDIHGKVATIYSDAYTWHPPQDYELNLTWNLRKHIKRWIHEWDLRRLYPGYDPDIEVEHQREGLEEEPDMERPSDESPDPETSS